VEISPDCSVPVVNFVRLPIAFFVVNLLVDRIDIVNIVLITCKVSDHGIGLVLHYLRENFVVYFLAHCSKFCHSNDVLWLQFDRFGVEYPDLIQKFLELFVGDADCGIIFLT
jgi:hypothetical protein